MITINFSNGKSPLEIDAPTVAEAVKKAVNDRIDLSRADLTGADLRWANLTGADLSRADLDGAKLAEADLTEANLTGATLNWADLRRANLDFSCFPLWRGSVCESQEVIGNTH